MDFYTEHFWFHANADPVPGEVLIQPIDPRDSDDLFRTTSEEIISFCGAVRLGAVGRSMTLRTTLFEISGSLVTLRILTPAHDYDAWNIVVPLADLQGFATQVLHRRFELYVESCFNGTGAADTEMMAGIGLFAALTQYGPMTFATFQD
jgi:hypothetical protein